MERFCSKLGGGQVGAATAPTALLGHVVWGSHGGLTAVTDVSGISTALFPPPLGQYPVTIAGILEHWVCD